ncbi:MAG: diacylglycerol kinase [Gammaproteobacteria bacterium]|nr:diacylglycerol kinase [Gammaproteobacteria bacterium]
MPKSQHRGLRRLTAATACSAAGLRAAWRHEEAFRQELVMTVALVPGALWLGQTLSERVLLVGSCLLVLIVELLNSAIEAVVDRVSHDHHELSAQAKDMGSAAVLISLVLAAAVWLAVAWDRFA